MPLITDQANLGQLYSSFTKILISTRDRATWVKIFGTEQLPGLVVYQWQEDGDRQILKPIDSDSSGSTLVAVELAPNFCLALVSFSTVGKQDLAKVSAWWQDRGSHQSLPQMVTLDGELPPAKLQAEFWQQMYSITAQDIQSYAQRITTLQKQYLRLRTLHENMQNAFATVEEYLSQAKLPEIQLAFDATLSDYAIEPSQIQDSNSLTLQQLLPVASRGLAAIAIHVAQGYPQGVGYLRIKLKACEDNTAIAIWQIPYAHLTPGWLNLDLPRINLGRKRDVELIIAWQTNLGPAPALSLTKLQSIPEARAYNSELVLERSLALRIWRGMPGTRKVTSPYLLLTSHQQPSATVTQLGYLGQGTMAGVQEVTPNLPTDDFEHIQVFDQGAKILTHPRADGSPTIALLPYGFAPHANQLIASIAIEHEQAGAIEYALAIISPETEAKTALDPEIALAYSGWLKVAPNTPQEITLDLTTPLKEHAHIILAAKLAPGSPPDFAWAHWLNFQLAKVEQKTSPDSDRPTDSKIIANVTLLRDASSDSAAIAFTKVQLIEEDTKIQVHPSQAGDTVAVISKAIAPGTVKIKSTICTENESASTVEYAIAAISTDDDSAARLAISSPNSALGFSGWQPLAANTLGELSLDLVVPTVETCHLVLATRLPEGSVQGNAWARWLGFEYVELD